VNVKIAQNKLNLRWVDNFCKTLQYKFYKSTLTWENIKENIQTSAKESLGLDEFKQNKHWFDEECLGFLDQRKRAKIQWIQDPSQSNVDNPNKVRREVGRHFRNKKRHI